MSYLVNEVFLSIHGEGFWSGRPAVFIRFAQCNLWTGLEKDRATAICTFCDTDFVHGTTYTIDAIIRAVQALSEDADMVILTGGEPLLQVDASLTRALHNAGYYVAVETNGTVPLKVTVDWVCVSPKPPKIRIARGDELKLVYPQERITPELFAHLKANRSWSIPGFDHFWLSPMDGPDLEANTKAAFDYVLAHPQWRLNIQSHKVIGVR